MSVIHSHLQQQLKKNNNKKVDEMSLYLCVCVCVFKSPEQCLGLFIFLIAVNEIPNFSSTTTVSLLFLCCMDVNKVVGISILHYLF